MTWESGVKKPLRHREWPKMPWPVSHGVLCGLNGTVNTKRKSIRENDRCYCPWVKGSGKTTFNIPQDMKNDR